MPLTWQNMKNPVTGTSSKALTASNLVYTTLLLEVSQMKVQFKCSVHQAVSDGTVRLRRVLTNGNIWWIMGRMAELYSLLQAQND